MSAYMAYTVTTRTNKPLFKKREFSVVRRFSDFLGLHDKLTEKYLKVGRIIPPAPEKSVIGECSYGKIRFVIGYFPAIKITAFLLHTFSNII